MSSGAPSSSSSSATSLVPAEVGHVTVGPAVGEHPVVVGLAGALTRSGTHDTRRLVACRRNSPCPRSAHLPHDVDVVVLRRRAPLALLELLAGVVDAQERRRRPSFSSCPVQRYHARTVSALSSSPSTARPNVSIDDQGDAEVAGHVDDRPAALGGVERGQRRQRGVVQPVEGVGLVVAHVLEPLDDVADRHLVVEVEHLDRARVGPDSPVPGRQAGGEPQGEQRLAGAALGEHRHRRGVGQ